MPSLLSPLSHKLAQGVGALTGYHLSALDASRARWLLRALSRRRGGLSGLVCVGVPRMCSIRATYPPPRVILSRQTRVGKRKFPQAAVGGWHSFSEHPTPLPS